MKDALITVKTENFDGESKEKLELTTPGKFAFRDGGYFIKYIDSCLGDEYGDVDTSVKLSSLGVVTVSRTGAYNSRFCLEKGKRCECMYSTPFGTVSMGFYGEKIESSLCENGGKLTLLYTVDFNKSQINKNKIEILVKDVK